MTTMTSWTVCTTSRSPPTGPQSGASPDAAPQVIACMRPTTVRCARHALLVLGSRCGATDSRPAHSRLRRRDIEPRASEAVAHDSQLAWLPRRYYSAFHNVTAMARTPLAVAWGQHEMGSTRRAGCLFYGRCQCCKPCWLNAAALPARSGRTGRYCSAPQKQGNQQRPRPCNCCAQGYTFLARLHSLSPLCTPGGRHSHAWAPHCGYCGMLG